jgi:flagellar hook-associated protein 1 FlgK
MSLTATLANALSGLTIAQRALSVTANNVANANTEGYVRKVLSQEAVFIGSRGAGVQASEISRITDEFLTAEVRRQASVVGRSEIPGRYQELLQDAFGAPGDSRDLAALVSELGAAIEAFANQPESATLALQVIQTANGLSATFGQLAEQVQVLRAQADEDIGRTVAEINAELQAIDDLNGEIERLAHLGQVGPELLDRRDALIRSLAEKIDVTTFVQEDNRIALYTAGGETLLDALPGSSRTTRQPRSGPAPPSVASPSSARTRSTRPPACRSTRPRASSWCRAACARASRPSCRTTPRRTRPS